MIPEKLHKAIFDIKNEQEFNEISCLIFRHQFDMNPVYQQYVRALGINPDSVKDYQKIPFIPAGFFKTHRVYCGGKRPEMVFSSSGTTGSARAKHYVSQIGLYEESFNLTFRIFYGDPAEYRIFALLPSYLEREDSSLIYMAGNLIGQSRSNESGFYLKNSQKLAELLDDTRQKTILFGVTFALLDLAEKYELNNPELIVMETGGMKGRRREMVREEVHAILCRRFNVPVIHSEYGMTELLSQAWSKAAGIFSTPPWMKILVRDANDPLTLLDKGKTGGINIIDLANLYSCSFIATEDLGKLHPGGAFEVLGRFDNSDIRGCNLMVV